MRTAVDVERARRASRDVTASVGFGSVDQEMVVLSVSELATNLVRYAHEGWIVVRPISDEHGDGVEVESRDSGPGIPLPPAVPVGDATTRPGLGGGLAAVRRLMDEFDLQTSSQGTVISCRKWRSRR